MLTENLHSIGNVMVVKMDSNMDPKKEKFQEDFGKGMDQIVEEWSQRAIAEGIPMLVPPDQYIILGLMAYTAIRSTGLRIKT